MQDDAVQYGKLIDDITEVIEAQVAVILSREQRPWTLLAQFVTTTGRLDVDRARKCRHNGYGGHLLYPIHFDYIVLCHSSFECREPGYLPPRQGAARAYT